MGIETDSDASVADADGAASYYISIETGKES